MKIIVAIKQVPARYSSLRIAPDRKWIEPHDLSIEIDDQSDPADYRGAPKGDGSTSGRDRAWNHISWGALGGAALPAGEPGFHRVQAGLKPGGRAEALAPRNHLHTARADRPIHHRGLDPRFGTAHPPPRFVIRRVSPHLGYRKGVGRAAWPGRIGGIYQLRDFAPRLAARCGETLIADVMGLGDALRTRQPLRMSAQTVDLASPPLILSVDRGIKENENISLVDEQAAALGARLAASRRICDDGWHAHGAAGSSSGRTVSPHVYLAVGISGAIQHLVGTKGSESVIATNTDRDAPISRLPTTALWVTSSSLAPALTAEVKKAKHA